MIVKNEKEVIRRCLGSVKRLIDYWVIVDTGSTDGTQEMIREFMKDVPGELHEREWVDFAHARNQALALAKGKGEFVLFIDADEEFTYALSFAKPRLSKDVYYVACVADMVQYKRKLLVKNSLNWAWEGVVHEVVDSLEARDWGVLEGVENIVRMEGTRSRDPDKYKKDIVLLEKALQADPNHARTRFFLAQSYRDAGDLPSALKAFEKRIELGGDREEVFWCLYQTALLQEILKKDHEAIVAGYCRAHQFLASRAEPLYDLARYLNNCKLHILAYLTCRFAMEIPPPENALVFHKNIYEYALLMELTRAAYWLGKYSEAYDASLQILCRKNLPDLIRRQANANLEDIATKWLEPAKPVQAIR